MAVTPVWKVYTDNGRDYVASFKWPDHAVAFAELMGSGAQVRFNHKRACWTAGVDEADSYDAAVSVINRRLGKSTA